VTFEVKTYTVRTTSDTTFSGGNCDDLRKERQVTVIGVLESPTLLRATRVTIKK
jgi:cytochrome c-type biogenesis protein CcmE